MARIANEDKLFEEQVVEDLLEWLEADEEYLVEQLAPKGRRPFTVQLTGREEIDYLVQMSPEGWRAMMEQVSLIQDPKQRNQASAELFERWATVQLIKRGVRTE